MKKIIFLLCMFLLPATSFAFPKTTIITNSDTQLSSLKAKEVKDIFTGKKTRWNAKTKIILAVLQDSKIHKIFLKTFVKKTPTQFRNFWRRKVFIGEGKIPKTFKSEAGLIDFVARTKGAVGYISTSTKKPVKIIVIKDKKGDRR